VDAAISPLGAAAALALPTAGYARRLRFSRFEFFAKRLAREYGSPKIPTQPLLFLGRLFSWSAGSSRQPPVGSACADFSQTRPSRNISRRAELAVGTLMAASPPGCAVDAAISPPGAVAALALPTVGYARRLRFSRFEFFSLRAG
jgi:hypothetical protein